MSAGKVDKVIYCFWTEDNPITENRQHGLQTMRENLGVSIEFLDKKGIEELILPEAPLHPGYKYLSAVHKSDYLRCYFMHHFGGGYADIKPYTKNNNWNQCFEFINNYPQVEIVGQHEYKDGIAVPSLRNEANAEIFVACGWMICRAKTNFTSEWYARILRKMDEKFESLQKKPATTPYGGDGYPLGWNELLGRIFHQWQYEVTKNNLKCIRNCLRTGWQGFDVAYR